MPPFPYVLDAEVDAVSWTAEDVGGGGGRGGREPRRLATFSVTTLAPRWVSGEKFAPTIVGPSVASLPQLYLTSIMKQNSVPVDPTCLGETFVGHMCGTFLPRGVRRFPLCPRRSSSPGTRGSPLCPCDITETPEWDVNAGRCQRRSFGRGWNFN